VRFCLQKIKQKARINRRDKTRNTGKNRNFRKSRNFLRRIRPVDEKRPKPAGTPKTRHPREQLLQLQRGGEKRESRIISRSENENPRTISTNLSREKDENGK